jgi:hypothetical protein
MPLLLLLLLLLVLLLQVLVLWELFMLRRRLAAAQPGAVADSFGAVELLLAAVGAARSGLASGLAGLARLAGAHVVNGANGGHASVVDGLVADVPGAAAGLL